MARNIHIIGLRAGSPPSASRSPACRDAPAVAARKRRLIFRGDIASFAPADFTEADLLGADLFGADLDTVTWTGATCPDGTSPASHGNSCANAQAFRLTGFASPKPGSTVAVSAKHVVVHFDLAVASGAGIPASVASAIGGAREVRATLAGPGIKATSAYCAWASASREFACTIADPRGIEKGKSHSYTVTVAEETDSAALSPRVFVAALRVGKAVNPEVIHFG
jgi:hypothetical protein